MSQIEFQKGMDADYLKSANDDDVFLCEAKSHAPAVMHARGGVVTEDAAVSVLTAMLGENNGIEFYRAQNSISTSRGMIFSATSDSIIFAIKKIDLEHGIYTDGELNPTLKSLIIKQDLTDFMPNARRPAPNTFDLIGASL